MSRVSLLFFFLHVCFHFCTIVDIDLGTVKIFVIAIETTSIAGKEVLRNGRFSSVLSNDIFGISALKQEKRRPYILVFA